MKTCHIVAAGDMGGVKIEMKDGDFLIAADAGYGEVRRQGLRADLVVGDFDSLGAEPQGENIIKHPVMKDDTDTMLAVRLGFERGYPRVYLYGMLGGARLDHTIANIQTLMYIVSQGGEGYIIGENCCLTALKDGELRFTKDARGIISVFCLGVPAEGVTLEGLLYPLNDYTLLPDMPLGVSNEFTGVPARVRVRNGAIVVLFGDIGYLEAKEC